ncbi:nudC domain-containing protein 1 [Chelonus insularis]|uniref:nudC domain-containing protein 1 n=1 Tax=Chelonus insularis TaxID=460826 RepID=UPI00158A1FDC|nr:nudC domain-containing protein 1 [Chelonus insularis]
MPKHLDLRPNQALLNLQFEKYQFSSELIPIDDEKELPIELLRIEPLPGQDSWLETRIFAFHNHLFKNPFDSSCWFYDQNYQVFRLQQDGTLNLVYSFSTAQFDKKTIKFNPTISFASDDIVVLTGVNNNLIIMITSPNKSSHKSLELNDIEQGILLDSRYIKEKSLLTIIMSCIIEENGKKKSKLIIVLYSLNIEEDTVKDIDHLIQRQELIVNGAIEYAYIESNGDFINLLSQEMAKFTFDSLKGIQMEESINEPIIKIPKYSWSQDEDSLTVWVKIPTKYQGAKPKIIISPIKISITVNNDTIIQGDFKFRIDHEASVWNFEEETLKIELMKHESGQMWDELIINDTDGECIPNEALAAEIHSRLSHLCTEQQDGNNEQSVIGFNSEQLEECDLEDNDNTLQRINLKTQTTTNFAIFGSRNRVLFGYKSKSCQILCSRYDHDACIWELKDSRSDDWAISHTTTFPGFGYVEASKNNKKFCLLAPNFSYIAIIEHSKYGFLYERPNKNERVAKQRIIDLGSDTQPILGAVATNENIFILTKDKLYSLKVI